ncbi:uncharacterized protein LOC120283245 [Dioscorea cayenensis subsp. rotundata]|uniref:Uncharacterized protein LOC120283245 n=1 Tax=Dioscorea cayennensis subsp. rotundata TaxID=55577 RepID=A0AB40D6E0_DIOCR|nr:uncharacterized protein LOC120283245 [Dioscorea cayenensis subsp. rotundata]
MSPFHSSSKQTSIHNKKINNKNPCILPLPTMMRRRREEKEDVSSESSSIGQPDQSSSEDEEQVDDEVQSKFKKPLIMSLNSIQEALPIKRGLSNYFNGKSKSFACLSDVMNGKALDLVKNENPFNKRRRILMATSRRASYNSLIQVDHNNNSSSCSSLPPLMLSSSNFTLEEEKEDDDHNDKLPLEGSSTSSSSSSLAPLSILDTKAFNKSFKSPRSFSLSDLQHV